MIGKIKFKIIKNQTFGYLSVFSKLFAVFLLFIFFAGIAPAQGTGSSVFIVSKAEKGTDAEAAASYLANQIGIGIQDSYPCVDSLTDKEAAALLDLERQRELLTGELDEENLQSLAGALGARYLVVVTSTTLPNGQTTVSAKVIDTQTGRTLANRMEAPVNADAVLDKADAVTKSIMQDLAGIFKNQCEPHWTGTITYSFKYQRGGTKSGEGSPGAMESNVKVNSSYSDKMESAIEVMLQPMSLGTEGTKTMARVVHKYDYQYERTASRTSTIRCRPPGVQSYLKETSGNSKEIMEEYGQKTETLPVYIYVSKSTGKYEISVQYPALTTKRNEERSGVSSGCRDEPYSETKTGENSPESEAYRESGSFTVRGQIDPKNPNYLSGKEVTGDLENGLYTTTWNLRFVKPKTKK